MEMINQMMQFAIQDAIDGYDVANIMFEADDTGKSQYHVTVSVLACDHKKPRYVEQSTKPSKLSLLFDGIVTNPQNIYKVLAKIVCNVSNSQSKLSSMTRLNSKSWIADCPAFEIKMQG